jgi:uncharacterized membrane protein HdeD (DUF308 family)
MGTVTSPPLGSPESQVLELAARRLWWLRLLTGIAWIVASLAILQFDRASVTTVSLIIGCMFVFSGVQQLVAAAVADSLRWLWFTFGVLFIAAGVLCFFNPEATFVGFADMLGFLLVLVGVWWIVEALIARDVNPLWWLGFASGVLMIFAAFWTSGQFFFDKAYTLLVVAGIWALLHGITDILGAFQTRSSLPAR